MIHNLQNSYLTINCRYQLKFVSFCPLLMMIFPFVIYSIQWMKYKYFFHFCFVFVFLSELKLSMNHWFTDWLTEWVTEIKRSLFLYIHHNPNGEMKLWNEIRPFSKHTRIYIYAHCIHDRYQIENSQQPV